MSDDRYDSTQKLMPGGTFTSGQEIHAAGAQSWQSDFEKEQAVGRYRTQQMFDAMSSANTNPYAGGGAVYTGGGASGPTSYKGLAVFAGLCLIAFVAFMAWSNARIQMPWHFGVFQDRALALDARSVATMRQMNMQNYRTLFVETAPLKDLFKGCRFRNCIEPDWQAFKLMQPFAARPATYESDVCALLFEREHVRYPADLLRPVWKIAPPLPQTSNPNSCMLVNNQAVWEAVKKHRTVTNVMIFGGAGLVVVLFLWLAFRKDGKDGKAAA